MNDQHQDGHLHGWVPVRRLAECVQELRSGGEGLEAFSSWQVRAALAPSVQVASIVLGYILSGMSG